MSVPISPTEGSHLSFDRGTLDRLLPHASEVITPQSSNYDEARAIWNGMIDRRPALIIRCRRASDVAEAVRFGRERGLAIAVRGGGHNIAGNAMVDGGLVIDLSPMKRVTVDAERRVACVEPGVTLGEFDREAQKFGLATPTGINSTTGIAGLTLGGGFGWLTRKYGLTIDNLLSAELVTADGLTMRASEHENEDLFWAIRGGGGNFGVVTSFEFRLHPVGPEVLSGLIVHPFAEAGDILRQYRDVANAASEEFTAWVVLRSAPPLPFLDPSVHGTKVVVIATLYAGNMVDGERALAPLRAIGRPHADVVSPHPYAGFQAAFDPLLAPGARNYWKSHNFAALSDGLIDAMVDAADEIPGPGCEIFLTQMGGAPRRIPLAATAYAQRDIDFSMNVHARWTDPAQDEECIGWARSVFGATAPYATGGVYVNFMTGDESERVRAAYGGNYDRIRAVKRKYDPANVFRINQNVRPAVTDD